MFEGLDVRALLGAGSSCVDASLVLSYCAPLEVCGLLLGFLGGVVLCRVVEKLNRDPLSCTWSRRGVVHVLSKQTRKEFGNVLSSSPALSKRFQAGSC
mmetsp:Transcript_51415/g.137217  ORF Transcript_51415/g.137217 Transcript_51415/m.137217 type:complete len:98 (+) Transcript_51415:140-433(+)